MEWAIGSASSSEFLRLDEALSKQIDMSVVGKKFQTGKSERNKKSKKVSKTGLNAASGERMTTVDSSSTKFFETLIIEAPTTMKINKQKKKKSSTKGTNADEHKKMKKSKVTTKESNAFDEIKKKPKTKPKKSRSKIKSAENATPDSPDKLTSPIKSAQQSDDGRKLTKEIDQKVTKSRRLKSSKKTNLSQEGKETPSEKNMAVDDSTKTSSNSSVAPLENNVNESKIINQISDINANVVIGEKNTENDGEIVSEKEASKKGKRVEESSFDVYPPILEGQFITERAVPPSLKAASNMEVPQYLSKIQAYFDKLSYQREGEPAIEVNIRLSIKNLNTTAKTIIKRGDPIKCLHALILGIHFTNHLPVVERFPIHFKSKVNGKEYKHVVLGVYLQGNFGCLGISRDKGLQDKPVSYPRLAELINDFYQSYHESGHILKELKIGSVITHDPYSMETISWKLGRVGFDLPPEIIELEIEKISRKLRAQMGSACLKGKVLPDAFNAGPILAPQPPPKKQLLGPSTYLYLTPNSKPTKGVEPPRSRSIPANGIKIQKKADHVNSYQDSFRNYRSGGNQQTRSRPPMKKNKN